MGTSKPKVSVIIPIYNAEEYLCECLDSVVNQTLREIEIICVNDGSTDRSLEILAEYAAQDPRIKIISKPNAGFGHTINCGIDAATGEYMGIVESDDYIKENMYESLYLTASNGKYDFVKSNFFRFVHENNERIFEPRMLHKHMPVYNKEINPSRTPELLKLTVINPAGIYLLDFIRKNKIRLNETPGASYQDNGFWFQVFSLAEKAFFVDEAFYMVRRDNPNSSVKNREKVYCVCEEYAFIRDFLDKHPKTSEIFLPYYHLARFDAYIFTLNRIADEYKKEFLSRVRQDLMAAFAANEIKREVFSELRWQEIQQIIEDPEQFYCFWFVDQEN